MAREFGVAKQTVMSALKHKSWARIAVGNIVVGCVGIEPTVTALRGQAFTIGGSIPKWGNRRELNSYLLGHSQALEPLSYDHHSGGVFET